MGNTLITKVGKGNPLLPLIKMNINSNTML